MKLPQLSLRDLFWLVALAACLTAWSLDHQRSAKRISELTPPEVVPTKVSKKTRRWATTQDPYGNPETLQFLAWSKGRCGNFASVELDSAGNCTSLTVDICYGVTDDDLHEISELRTLETLSFWGKPMTDNGLKLIEAMPQLRSLSILEAVSVSDAAIERLQTANPALQVSMTSRD